MGKSVINRGTKITVYTYTFAGFDGNSGYSFSIPTIQGYTCVGVVGFLSRGSDQVGANLCDIKIDISSQTCTITNYNHYSGSAYSLDIYLLYVSSNAVINL